MYKPSELAKYNATVREMEMEEYKMRQADKNMFLMEESVGISRRSENISRWALIVAINQHLSCWHTQQPPHGIRQGEKVLVSH